MPRTRAGRRCHKIWPRPRVAGLIRGVVGEVISSTEHRISNGEVEIAASAYGLLAMTILSGTVEGRGVVFLLQVGRGAATIPRR